MVMVCIQVIGEDNASPVIGYDKASAIAHKANDEDLTLNEAALGSGFIEERRFDEIVDPKQMTGHGVAGS
jgi:fumarate hydratase class II